MAKKRRGERSMKTSELSAAAVAGICTLAVMAACGGLVWLFTRVAMCMAFAVEAVDSVVVL